MLGDGDPLCPSGAVVLRGRRGSIERSNPASRWVLGLCTWCCETITAPRRTMWCSSTCNEAYALTQPEVLAGLVEERDHGVCEICTLNTWRLHNFFRRYGSGWGRWCSWALDRSGPEAMLARWRRHGWGGRAVTQRSWVSAERPFRLLGLEPRLDLFPRSRWWDMDHRVPIIEGGALFDLGNLRTLCPWCHTRETAALAGRRADARRGDTEAA